MSEVDPPGRVKRLIADIQAGPTLSEQGAHLPGGVLALHQPVHLAPDVLLRLAGDGPAVQVDLTLRGHGIQRCADAGNA